MYPHYNVAGYFHPEHYKKNILGNTHPWGIVMSGGLLHGQILEQLFTEKFLYIIILNIIQYTYTSNNNNKSNEHAGAHY
jgi:hypothetical protein